MGRMSSTKEELGVGKVKWRFSADSRPREGVSVLLGDDMFQRHIH